MRVATTDQLLTLLDQFFDDGSDLTRRENENPWAEILARPDHPLRTDYPDACLVDWRDRGLLPVGEGRRALDIGCGLGRNTRWLARQGWTATGVDLSPYAVEGARARSGAGEDGGSADGEGVTFHEADVLRDEVPGGPFDLVHDSGLFHHLPPHRRITYLAMLERLLAPGGTFTIVNFAPGQMGSEADDLALLRQGRLEGGIAYSPDELQQVLSGLEFVEAGSMPPPDQGGGDHDHHGHGHGDHSHEQGHGTATRVTRVGEEGVFALEVLGAALFRRPAGSAE